MQVVILLYVFALVSVDKRGAKASEEKENCEGVEVHDKFHKKHVIGMGLNRPYQLAYDHSEHKVFFSYNFGKDDEDLFEIGYIEKGHIKHKFAIDGDNDIFITNETGLYRIKNGTDHRIFYEGPKLFRAIEINNKGRAYFTGQNGIFIANKESNTLEKIAHIKNIFGLAFDNDNNIIYSNPSEIIKLVPEECN
ncbi:unnamed protein product, partial [Brenthis ino]